MAKGRDSARPTLVLGLAIMCLILAMTQPTLGATYNVGGAGGWTFSVSSWPNGKSFKAGDILAFNYASGVHNVVQVNKGVFDSCGNPKGAKVYQSGKDTIRLSKGPSYFICTLPGHCQGGMKIAVNAS